MSTTDARSSGQMLGLDGVTAKAEGDDAADVIHRFEVPVDDQWHEFDVSGDVLHVAARRPGVVDFWAYARGGGAPLRLRVYGTGHLLPGGLRYVGTAVAEPFVWHLMEESS